MTRFRVVVALDSQRLGLDPYGGETTVAPATNVFACVCEPRIQKSNWDADFQRSEWEDTKKTFEAWGRAMVTVSPFGITVGEYIVEPYLITSEQFSILEAAR